MKNLILLSIVSFLILSCSSSGNKAEKSEKKQDAIVLTVDELYDKAPDLADKEVFVKGTVMHVCKEGGARCFLMGSSEDVNIRVEAGEKIGAFKQEQLGSEMVISGMLKIVKTEADAHNPGAEHGTATQPTDSATAEAHKVIAAAQDSAEVVYFIEGISAKELKVPESK